MLTERMQADLTRAMKARDKPAVRALRTTLAAVANAEAPPVDDTGGASFPEAPVVGRLVDHPRLVLSDADIERIVQREIDERREAIDEYTRLGRDTEAAEIAAEVVVLEQLVR